MKILVASLALLFCCLHVFSQNTSHDTLYKRNGEIVVAKVIEISPDYVKYITPGNDNPVIAIDKDDLIKIVFANGLVQRMVPEMINPEHYSDQKKNAIKIDFLSPMFYHTTIVFERSIKPGISWETGASIVGLGHNPDDSGIESASGVVWSAGIKLIKSPDYYLKGMRYAHILKGGYIRPQIWLGYFEETSKHEVYNSNTYPYYYTESVKNNYTVGGIHLQLGKQWVFDNSFLVDFYGGLGYAFTSDEHTDNPYDYNSKAYYYVFSKTGADSPFSFSGGLRIGILF
jgi:hypothetical protein